MSFHDVLFPLRWATGSLGGPEHRTQVIERADGSDVRVQAWAGSRRRWDVAGAITSLHDAADLIAFFEARAGRVHGFRFRDPLDDRSCPPGQSPTALDQSIASGDGQTVAFALTKAYGDVIRRIRKPVPGSVRIAVDGVEIEDAITDALTGMIRLPEPPVAGASITAGYVFDCAVRFDTDRLETRIEAPGAARIVSVPILELPNGG